MNASVELMGGTTLEMIMPSTLAMSSPAGEKRLWSRMPHSSAVWSWTVRRRHWQTSWRPSNAPMVMLLLPASSASSTNASCKDQGIGSVVTAHDQVAVGVQTGGSAFDATFRLMHDHAPPRDVAGGAGEQREDRLFVLACDGVDSWQQRGENALARKSVAFVDTERRGLALQVGREQSVVHVDSNAGDGVRAGKLHQDAGDLSAIQEQ